MKRAGGRRGEADEASSLVSELEVNEGNWQPRGVGRVPAVCYSVLERFTMANRRTGNTKERFRAAEKQVGTGRGTGHLGEGRRGLVETV